MEGGEALFCVFCENRGVSAGRKAKNVPGARFTKRGGYIGDLGGVPPRLKLIRYCLDTVTPPPPLGLESDFLGSHQVDFSPMEGYYCPIIAL